MIKKKIVSPAVKPSIGKLPIKSQRPAPPAVEPEEEDEDYVDQEDEEDQEEEPTQKKKKLSKASVFNAVSTTGQATDIPAGRHEAVISSIILYPANDKGQSVRWNFEVCNSDFKNNNLTSWNKLFYGKNDPNHEEGEACVPGISIMKQALAKIGYDVVLEEEDEEMEELQKIFAEITNAEEKVGVLLSLSYKDVGGRVFPQIFVDGPCDNEAVQEYRDRVAY